MNYFLSERHDFTLLATIKQASWWHVTAPSCIITVTLQSDCNRWGCVENLKKEWWGHSERCTQTADSYNTQQEGDCCCLLQTQLCFNQVGQSTKVITVHPLQRGVKTLMQHGIHIKQRMANIHQVEKWHTSMPQSVWQTNLIFYTIQSDVSSSLYVPLMGNGLSPPGWGNPRRPVRGHTEKKHSAKDYIRHTGANWQKTNKPVFEESTCWSNLKEFEMWWM